MPIVFDPSKDAANVAKHGVSLALASDMEILAVQPDLRRDYGETRTRAFGLIAGAPIRRNIGGMSPGKRPDPIGFDEENPEWTEDDFRTALGPESLPPEVLAAFSKTRVRGAQKRPTKVPVSVRLSSEVIEHFRAGGAGWQTRIDEALKQIIARKLA